MLIQIVPTFNYSDIADSHTLQFATARAKSCQSAVSSLGTAWQRILSFRVQRLPSSLALLHCKLHSTVHCLASDSFHDWLSCAQSGCSVTASKGKRSSSSGLTSLQAGDYPSPASCPHSRLSTTTSGRHLSAVDRHLSAVEHSLTGLG
jgi:hypothetical protein